jgi:flavin-dependent dehydrogenase
MAGNSCDVAIIGGGPAGATTAIYLRRHGYKVVVLEKVRFPRFHIGESLLPENLALFDELGIQDRIRQRGYTKKFGAEFVSRCGKHVRKFYFRNSLLPGATMAYQVLRSDFDLLLLDRAREVGADVREQSAVTDVVPTEDAYELEVTPDQGEPYKIRAGVLVDASGQDTFLSSRWHLKKVDRRHRRFAVFSHFRYVDRDTGDDAGNIRIIPFGDGHWFWVIPLSDDLTSVGAVVTKEIVREHRDDLERYLLSAVKQTPALEERMSRAEQVEPVRAIADFSYESSRYGGTRFLIVGDAAAFLDPVFSSGVLMAMSSGKEAAKSIHSAFQRKDFKWKALRAYEREHRRKVRTYFRLIRAYYRPAFLDMFMNPTDFLGLKAAIATLLAGNAERRFRLWWRVELFYFIGWMRGFMRPNRSRSTGVTECSHGCSVHSGGA